MSLFARASGFMLARGLVRRSREVLVAASTASPVCHDHALVGLREIVDQLAALNVVDDCAYWSLHDDVRAGLAGAVGAFAVASALRVVFGIEAEVNQRVMRLTRFHDHIAAATTVAARGAAARDELLPAEGNAPVAAVAGLDADFRFVDEHLKLASSCQFPVAS